MSQQDINQQKEISIKGVIAAAVGMSWAAFKLRNPAQALTLGAIINTPIVPELIASLEKDEETYEELVAITERETDLATIVSAIAPVVERILMSVIAA